MNEFIGLFKATTLGICGKGTVLYHGIQTTEYLNIYVDGTDSALFTTEENRMFLYIGPDKLKYIVFAVVFFNVILNVKLLLEIRDWSKYNMRETCVNAHTITHTHTHTHTHNVTTSHKHTNYEEGQSSYSTRTTLKKYPVCISIEMPATQSSFRHPSGSLDECRSSPFNCR